FPWNAKYRSAIFVELSKNGGRRPHLEVIAPDRRLRSSRRIRGRGQVAVDGELHQTDKVVNAQFSHDIRAVGVHGFGADVQELGDVFRTHAVHQEGKDLVLAAAERTQRIFRRRFAWRFEQIIPAQERRNILAAVLNITDGIQK